MILPGLYQWISVAMYVAKVRHIPNSTAIYLFSIWIHFVIIAPVIAHVVCVCAAVVGIGYFVCGVPDVC